MRRSISASFSAGESCVIDITVPFVFVDDVVVGDNDVVDEEEEDDDDDDDDDDESAASPIAALLLLLLLLLLLSSAAADLRGEEGSLPKPRLPLGGGGALGVSTVALLRAVSSGAVLSTLPTGDVLDMLGIRTWKMLDRRLVGRPVFLGSSGGRGLTVSYILSLRAETGAG